MSLVGYGLRLLSRLQHHGLQDRLRDPVYCGKLQLQNGSHARSVYHGRAGAPSLHLAWVNELERDQGLKELGIPFPTEVNTTGWYFQQSPPQFAKKGHSSAIPLLPIPSLGSLC